MKLVFIGKKKRGGIFEGGFHYRGSYIKAVKVSDENKLFKDNVEYLIEGVYEKCEEEVLHIRAVRVVSLCQLELCPQS